MQIELDFNNWKLLFAEKNLKFVAETRLLQKYKC